MKKIKISKKEKRVLLFQAIGVFFFVVFVFIISEPRALSPISGKAILDNDFVFEVENGEKIILANNKGFENPVTLDEESYVTLAPGKYYWKAKGGFRESETNSFIINEVVGLEIGPDSFGEGEKEMLLLKNSGTVDLNISKRDKNTGNVTSGMILDVGEIKRVEKEGSTYEGKRNG